VSGLTPLKLSAVRRIPQRREAPQATSDFHKASAKPRMVIHRGGLPTTGKNLSEESIGFRGSDVPQKLPFRGVRCPANRGSDVPWISWIFPCQMWTNLFALVTLGYRRRIIIHDNQDILANPPTLLQRRLIDAAADIMDTQADSPEFLHAALCFIRGSCCF
jgi:hypothetical protein